MHTLDHPARGAAFDPALEALPKGRHAFEFRHESFLTDRFLELLREHNIALVGAGAAQRRDELGDDERDPARDRQAARRQAVGAGARDARGVHHPAGEDQVAHHAVAAHLVEDADVGLLVGLTSVDPGFGLTAGFTYVFDSFFKAP